MEERVAATREAGESVDYLTFAPQGEPTLDSNLGPEIALLRPLGIPVAVITNASLVWREDVREDLTMADYVSLKVDSVNEATWRRLNRPHRKLKLSTILDGMLEFADGFDGELTTETMLIEGINDDVGEMEAVAEFLAELQPTRAYLSIPTRPPAENWVLPPDEGTVNAAYQVLCGMLDHVETLTGYEADAFVSAGDVIADLLGIAAVHPMRESAVRALLEDRGVDWSRVQQLIERGELMEVDYQGETFYVRRFPTRRW